MSAATAILFVAESRRQAIAVNVRAAVLDWLEHWSGTRAETWSARYGSSEPAAVIAGARSAEWWYGFDGDDVACLRVFFEAEALAVLLGLPQSISTSTSLSAPPDSLARAYLANALLDLLGRFAALGRQSIMRLATGAEEIPAFAAAAYLTIDMPQREAVIRLEACAAWLESALGRRPAAPGGETLTQRATAVGFESVQIDAVLGSASVSLSDLHTLRNGDVVVLDETLDQPVHLRERITGRSIGAAKLGRQDSARAVKFV